MLDHHHNRLANEKSPYLLQHADNPVDWYPWGEEAFARAEQEDRPVFLSIGYSTCHWCHVMAHESFQDREVAALMNDTFVSIKVDREERPDIDMQYMKVCQMMTGSGGWPLTIIMSPSKEPFFAATYIPKESRFGRAGLTDLIPRIKELWTTRREELQVSAQQIVEALQQGPSNAIGRDLGEAELHLGYEQLRTAFDRDWGGFSIAPKFPSPHTLLFLLRYWKRTGKAEALTMVEKTLQAMLQGGIQDHIGYGFHRYSTDRHWLVPHFEKMLYDQAMLASAFVEAYQATRKEEYAATARHIFAYVLRDMTGPEGGFYAAEDADSEGVEGKFYLWTAAEIRNVLGTGETHLFLKAFNIEEAGNFTGEVDHEKTGANIPHRSLSLEQLAAEFQIPPVEIEKRLESARQKLFIQREKRVHPQKDDKVLTDWNGLMIAALAQGARVLQEPSYADSAARAVDFIFSKMVDAGGRLYHRYRGGEAAFAGNLDDYAFLVHGLLEMYETSFEVRHLKRALALTRQVLVHFHDAEGGGFYFTPDDGEILLTRQKEIYDGAVPSGNSLAMLDLLRLARITGDTELEEKAARTGKAFSDVVRESPSAHAQLMAAVDFAVGPSYEVVVAGEPHAHDTTDMLRALVSAYVPNKVMLLLPALGDTAEIGEIAPFTKTMGSVDNKATAYVCSNHTCQFPTTDIATMLRLLDAGSGSPRPPLPTWRLCHNQAWGGY